MNEADFPTRVAFCRILHTANGGRLTPLGLPILEEGVRGLCDVAYDCASCVYMQQWLQHISLQGYVNTWECDMCLAHTSQEWRYLPGHFQEGQCQRCGFDTPFLQLVCRREVLPPFPWPNQEDPTK